MRRHTAHLRTAPRPPAPDGLGAPERPGSAVRFRSRPGGAAAARSEATAARNKPTSGGASARNEPTSRGGAGGRGPGSGTTRGARVGPGAERTERGTGGPGASPPPRRPGAERTERGTGRAGQAVPGNRFGAERTQPGDVAVENEPNPRPVAAKTNPIPAGRRRNEATARPCSGARPRAAPNEPTGHFGSRGRRFSSPVERPRRGAIHRESPPADPCPARPASGGDSP
jgi:hypothetical protein